MGNRRTIDGITIYLPAGHYVLRKPWANPYVPLGFLPAQTSFIVERHVDKIGNQLAYEYYSIRLARNNKHIVKSYHGTAWNLLATNLVWKSSTPVGQWADNKPVSSVF